MKNVIKILFVVAAIAVIVFSFIKKDNNDYIRIHIRANSEEYIDREVKIDIKDLVNSILIEQLSNAKTKQEGIEIIQNNIDYITKKCNIYLHEHGFSYNANVRLDNEYFPSRNYANTTVESGYFDSLTIDLGSASGDNWWCVMYPPLCYKGKENKISFSSRIKEWILKIFS